MDGREIDEGGYLGDRSIRRARRSRGGELDTRKVTRYRSEEKIVAWVRENEVRELALGCQLLLCRELIGVNWRIRISATESQAEKIIFFSNENSHK